MIGRWTKETEPVRSFTLDLARQGQQGQRYLGTRTVPVDAIVGSVGRSHELGADFLPRRKSWGFSRETSRYRWVKKAMAEAGSVDLDAMYLLTRPSYSHGDYWAKSGVTLPPVELYKLGPVYYVLDGHHRVAAARSLGQLEMEAMVTEYLSARSEEATSSAA